MRPGKIFLGKAGKTEADIRRQKQSRAKGEQKNQVHQNRIKFDEKRPSSRNAKNPGKKHERCARQKPEIFFEPHKKRLPSPASRQKQVQKPDKNNEKRKNFNRHVKNHQTGENHERIKY